MTGAMTGTGSFGRGRAGAAFLTAAVLAGWGLAPRPALAGQGHQYTPTIGYDRQGVPLTPIASFDSYTAAENALNNIVHGLSLTNGPKPFEFYYAIIEVEKKGYDTSYVLATTINQYIAKGYYSPSPSDPSITLPAFPGALPNGEVAGAALSTDGTTVVGRANYGGKTPTTYSLDHAFRWTQATGTVDIDGRDRDTYSSGATAVSGDGSVVAGYMSTDASGQTTHAFRWTQRTGMADLGTLSGTGNSQAQDISADGSTIVGQSSVVLGSGINQATLRHAFSWTSAQGMKDLGTLPNRYFGYSGATAVSANGAAVVGWSDWPDPAIGSNREHAVIWHGGGITDLGVIGGDHNSRATAISGDGTVVVGTSSPDLTVFENGYVEGTEHAFRWTKATGTRDLKSLLSGAGLDMKGIRLLTADGLSPDGSAIIGRVIMPGATGGSDPVTPGVSHYLVTYIDKTNFEVARKEGLIDTINAALTGDTGGTGGMTTTGSVQGSIDAMGAAGWSVVPQEATFDGLLNDRFTPPMAEGSMIAPVAAWGSNTYGLRGRLDLGNGLMLKGGIGTARHHDGAVEVDSPVIFALGLRWTPPSARPVHPFFEFGGTVAPNQTATFTRSYASGASGASTGIGSAKSRLARGYLQAGIAAAPTARLRYEASLTLGRGSFHHDAYTEAAGPSNPFPASFAAGTDRATTLRLGGRLAMQVSKTASLGLDAGIGRVWGHSGTGATVAGSPYTAANGAATWVDYGVDLNLHTGPRTDLDLFVVGITGGHGIGHHAEAGLSLTVRL